MEISLSAHNNMRLPRSKDGHDDVQAVASPSQRLFAAAREPKRLLPLAMRSDDGFGGHVTALYEQLPLLMPLLHELAGVPWSPQEPGPLRSRAAPGGP